MYEMLSKSSLGKKKALLIKKKACNTYLPAASSRYCKHGDFGGVYIGKLHVFDITTTPMRARSPLNMLVT